VRLIEALLTEIFPARSIRRVVSTPPDAIAACNCAVAESPSVKLIEVSPEEMFASVAITADPSNSSADPPVA
jgi:hypothetical protein